MMIIRHASTQHKAIRFCSDADCTKESKMKYVLFASNLQVSRKVPYYKGF